MRKPPQSPWLLALSASLFFIACSSSAGPTDESTGKTAQSFDPATLSPPTADGADPIASCRQSFGPSCFAIATVHAQRAAKNEEAREDAKRAAVLYARSCQLGVVPGCHRFALLLAAGKGMKADRRRATKILSIACEEGHAISCYELARLQQQRKTESGQARSQRILTTLSKGCSRREPQACHDMGMLYSFGKHIPRDHFRAFRAFDRACLGGMPQGCLQMEWLRARGCPIQRQPAGANQDCKSPPAKPETLAALLKKQCDSKGGRACVAHALYLERAQGTDKKPDLQGAARIYNRACDEGDGWACLNLAELFRLGRGRPVDPSAALTYYLKACDRDYELACQSAAIAKINGAGTEQNLPEGVLLLRAACRGGYSQACEQLLVLCGLGHRDACPPNLRTKEP